MSGSPRSRTPAPNGRLDTLETACGSAIGMNRGYRRSTRSRVAADTPRAALERQLQACLSRPPCRIAFSGGYDSSAMLALAAHVARRDGLRLPIPTTSVFPGIESAEEDDWQELVIDHLGLRDEWLRLPLTDELDLVGPVSDELSDAADGLHWPSNLHFLVPLARAGGAGGSLITGVGGDELLTPGGRHNAAMFREGLFRPRTLREAIGVAGSFAPTPLRVAGHLAQRRVTMPWLTPAANRRLALRWAVHEGQQPVGWDAIVRLMLASRYVTVMLAGSAAVSQITRVDVCHPFLAPDVVDAFASEHGRLGPRSRGDAIRHMGVELLPPPLLDRQTKAGFDEAFWGPRTAEFARGAAIGCLPANVRALIDEDWLADDWAKPLPNGGTHTLLQVAWRARQRERS